MKGRKGGRGEGKKKRGTRVQKEGGRETKGEKKEGWKEESKGGKEAGWWEGWMEENVVLVLLNL